MRVALYPGSFDPVTRGHVDIAARASALFDHLVLGVFDAPVKNLLFTTQERRDMLKEAVAHIPNVSVRAYNILTIEFAKELDTETIQVSVVHAFPGTDLYNYAARNNFLASEAATDAGGFQLPHLVYPGLGREEMMAAMNHFYDAYYFRPRVVWRIVRQALWDAGERRRLYHEAVGFFRVRAERRKYACSGFCKAGVAAASAVNIVPGPPTHK